MSAEDAPPVGPWRSIPTGGWTTELVDRWLTLEEQRLELDREYLDLARQRFAAHQATRAKAAAEERIEREQRHQERMKRAEVAEVNARAKLIDAERRAA